ncbi:uncharacterized protein ASPGLDRAFT_41572 [Aspergillus glaucus CBS 516.65]|uniref:CRIB domain-containing protein n=1 Tax=Aspergillus glaucus CBS 516.65 TaxID=1160497 RepID=A0A1L9W046_ASPGL|nr:hypothetical protein ASPGLDRAFT_41572 [Aspergillus glaucus CBS 516.65]OJJ89544.1 hypothetical protein ASPGLDRAFT_41572 [Aspergillus glaucus CBS 516.65]
MHSAHPSISFPPREDTHNNNNNNNNNHHHHHHHDSDPIHARSRSSAHVFPNSPKRRSVFSGRSRSNTTTTSSTTTSSSSRRSPASSMTSTDQAPSFPSHESSYPAGQFPPLRTERQDSITKSLFSRGSRILRRQGSKFNISATLDEVDEGEREKPRFDVTDIFGRHRSRQSDARSDDNLKRLISDPFDFHHLTHTSPSHVQALQRARENELVTEFSAIRASQKPINSLKGIRAEDLHFRNFSSEDLAPGVATSGDDEHAFAVSDAPDAPDAPASPPASPGAASSVSPKAKPAQRESRVYENFSRPVSRYPRTGSTSSITSPPRRPSRQSSASPDLVEPETRVIDDVLGMNATQQDYHELVYPRKPSLSQMNLAGLFESDDESRPRAGSVGTDARISSTNLALDLEDVPEEEEATTHWHDSPEQAEKSDSRRLSPAPADMGPSSSNLSVPKSHPSICVAEELSKKFSEVLASPTIPQYRLYQQQQPQEKAHRKSQQASRGSVSKRESVIDINIDSWDADIDYCYEHAAESTSDFDWTRRSFDEPQHPVIEEEPDEEEQSSKPQSTHLSTSSLACPDLDPSPSRSVPSTQFAVTPSTTTYEGDYFQQVPASFFASTKGKNMSQDTLYDEYNADAASDRHFSFCSQGVIKAPMDHQVSPRSSFSPISNCNSQESLILSRAASIARKHRSSISTTSVPELIHSLASSRETMPAESPSVPSLPEAHHRQTKSLETSQALFGSTASLDSADISPGTVSHDRAKSTSDLIEAAKADVVPSLPQTGTVKNAGRKKSRTSSYSLFPTS